MTCRYACRRRGFSAAAWHANPIQINEPGAIPQTAQIGQGNSDRHKLRVASSRSHIRRRAETGSCEPASVGRQDPCTGQTEL